MTHSNIRQRLLLAGTLALAAGASQAAGTVYLNGKVYTQDGRRSVAQAFVVEQDGRFGRVGSTAELAGLRQQGYAVVDLRGRMVLPGLHDNHIHAMGTVPLDMCDLDGKPVNLDQLANKVRGCLSKYAPQQGDWLVVNQWSPYDGNTPTRRFKTVRAALDAAAPDRPVALMGVDGHAAAYNSRALALARDKDGNTVGYNAATLGKDGVLASQAQYVDLNTGVIREGAREAVPVPDTGLLSASSDKAAALYDAILPRVSALMAQSGITGIQDACSNDFVRQRYLGMQQRGLLHMRVTAATCFHMDDYGGKLDIPAHLARAEAVRAQFAANPLIKADTVKIFVDGTLEGDPFTEPPFLPNAGMLHNFQLPHIHYDAARDQGKVTADSRDSGQNGTVNFAHDALLDYATALDKAGFGIHLHSIGDRSTRWALDALQAARQRNGNSGIPHTIAHLQMVHPDDQQRLGELGVYLTFTYAWMNPQLAYDMLVTPFLQAGSKGQDLAAMVYDPKGYVASAVYPVESSRRAGAVLAAGSDAPVDSRDPRPFTNIAAALTRVADGKPYYNAAQHTSLDEILAAYTINGARAVRQGDITGSIESGKSADFIVLDRNLYQLMQAGKPQRIADTRVELTVFQGQPVYRRGR